MKLQQHLASFPFIAITRGISPDMAKDCCHILAKAGFVIIETPLNSPHPLKSIECMANHIAGSACTPPDNILIGAGTVTAPGQVEQVKNAGGTIIISPHCDPAIIRATKAHGLLSISGVATPTEAFTAIQAGADGLKLFPAEIITPAAVKAMRAILPPRTQLIAVGGINSSNWQSYHKVGVTGFGLGSSLYSPTMTLQEIAARAQIFSTSWHEATMKGK